MEENKVPKIRVAANAEDKTMTLQNLSEEPIVLEFASSIKGLEDKPVTLEPGYILGIRLSLGIAPKDPEPASPQPTS